MDIENNSSVIKKVTRILDAFSRSKKEFGLSELSSFTDLPKATVLRIMNSLRIAGFIYQDQTTRKYRLGYKIITLGEIAKDTLDLVSLSKDHMNKLMLLTNETVKLAILTDRYEAVVLEKIECNNPLRHWTNVGEVVPLFAGAIGKAIGAYLSDREFAQAVQIYQERNRKDGVIDEKEILKEFSTIRDNGWAESHGELYEGVRGIAAPIRSMDGSVFASISIAGPATRFNRIRARKTIPILMDEARQISKALGFNGSTS